MRQGIHKPSVALPCLRGWAVPLSLVGGSKLTIRPRYFCIEAKTSSALLVQMNGLGVLVPSPGSLSHPSVEFGHTVLDAALEVLGGKDPRTIFLPETSAMSTSV
jgi:hypothetical protein